MLTVAANKKVGRRTLIERSEVNATPSRNGRRSMDAESQVPLTNPRKPPLLAGTRELIPGCGIFQGKSNSHDLRGSDRPNINVPRIQLSEMASVEQTPTKRHSKAFDPVLIADDIYASNIARGFVPERETQRVAPGPLRETASQASIVHNTPMKKQACYLDPHDEQPFIGATPCKSLGSPTNHGPPSQSSFHDNSDIYSALGWNNDIDDLC